MWAAQLLSLYRFLAHRHLSGCSCCTAAAREPAASTHATSIHGLKCHPCRIFRATGSWRRCRCVSPLNGADNVCRRPVSNLVCAVWRTPLRPYARTHNVNDAGGKRKRAAPRPTRLGSTVAWFRAKIMCRQQRRQTESATWFNSRCLLIGGAASNNTCMRSRCKATRYKYWWGLCKLYERIMFVRSKCEQQATLVNY